MSSEWPQGVDVLAQMISMPKDACKDDKRLRLVKDALAQMMKVERVCGPSLAFFMPDQWQHCACTSLRHAAGLLFAACYHQCTAAVRGSAPHDDPGVSQ